jgi:hypothetical protein
MGLKHISNTFTDTFGNVTTSYKANAGDKIVLTTVVEANILIQEDNINSFQIDWINYELQLLGKKSWKQEGFIIGDSVSLKIYKKADWTLEETRTFTVDAVNDTIIRFTSSMGSAFDKNSYILQLSTTRNFDELDFNLNHIDNSANPTYNSLIDGELTTVKFKDLNALSVSGTKTGLLIGKQSGQYLISSVLTRNTDAHNSRVYTIVSTFIQSGIYKEDWFSLGTCLKLCYKYSFYSVAGDISNLQTLEFSENANTGWFDEPFNTEVVNSTLTTGITSLDYATASNKTIVIDSSNSNLYLGACYISNDTTYYKNKVDNQKELSYLLNAYIPLAVGTYNDFNSGYTIEITSITTVGTVKTIEFDFTPLFTTFIESRDIDDRLFYIWVRCGNINHLVFKDQLTKQVDSELPLSVDEDETYFIRHNINSETDVLKTLTKSNIEDDLAFRSVFNFTNGDIWNSVKLSIIAYNNVTFEEFDLDKVFFDLSNAPVNSSGQYLLNEFQSVGNDLPSTSLKKQAHLTSDLINDVWTIYYPFINNWKYWETQINAPNDFYPNQNNNWLNFMTGDWSIATKITRSSNETDYTYRKSLPISDYNTEPLINTTFELYTSDNTLVTAIISGEVMTLNAIHDHTTITGSSFWGEITIEETESSPRYLLSTIIDFDNNSNSPITPISGTKLTTVTVGNITTFSCLLDSNKLNKDAKITSKIYIVGDYEGVEFENGDVIQFEDGSYVEWD